MSGGTYLSSPRCLFYLWVKICPHTEINFYFCYSNVWHLWPQQLCKLSNFSLDSGTHNYLPNHRAWILTLDFLDSRHRSPILSDSLSFYILSRFMRISWPCLFGSHKILTYHLVPSFINTIHSHVALSPNLKLPSLPKPIAFGEVLISYVYLPFQVFTFNLSDFWKPWFLITIWPWYGEATVGPFNIWLLVCQIYH